MLVSETFNNSFLSSLHLFNLVNLSLNVSYDLLSHLRTSSRGTILLKELGNIEKLFDVFSVSVSLLSESKNF